jgi:ribosomal protein S18 acetylase RimI-like enzyme
MSVIQTRVATLNDCDFILSLIPRLSEFGPPVWRDVEMMMAIDRENLTGKLTQPSTGTVIFIAEDENANPLGFIHVHEGNDFYYKQPHAHISDVIVSPQASGRGVGLTLMNKAETWAKERGYQWITLSVFAQNLKARELYTREGYGEDIMKYVKQL